MNQKTRTTLMLAAMAGACVGVASAQNGGMVNISGATLLENYVKAPASTNDFIDVDGDGIAGWLGSLSVDQLAIGGPAGTAGQSLVVQYRVAGSVNGFKELTGFGYPRCVSGGDDEVGGILGNRPQADPPVLGVASFAYHNRVLYINNGNSGGIPSLYNQGNPGGAPNRVGPDYRATFASPPFGSAGFMCIDIAPIDVSSFLAVQKAGDPAWNRRSSDPGYGRNPRLSVARPFGAPGFGGLSHQLADLDGRNLFDPTNPSAADANTIFDTSLAFAAITPVINPGTGMRRVSMTELQYLFGTGRAASGENLVVITRDVGSGTRNAFQNCIGQDPSWGIGDNVGGLSTSGADHVLGSSYTPTNKGSNGGVEQVLRNTRLGIGYVGTERGVTGSGSGSWLSTGALEIPDVLNDIYGGTQYVRPTTANLVNNSANGWLIGGQAVLATVGDPRSAPANLGGQGWAGAFDPYIDLNSNGQWDPGEPYTDLNGNGQWDGSNAEAGMPARTTPPMQNPFAAAYMNNISRSIAAVNQIPDDAQNLGMPGEFAATQFLLTAARDNLHDDLDYTNMIPNPDFNPSVQAYTLANNVHNNAAFISYNESTCGRVPARATGAVYSDGVAGGAYYINQKPIAGGGDPDANRRVPYGAAINCRNKIAGDFDGSGARDAGDVCEMLKAYRQRSGGPVWAPADGIYGPGAGAEAIIEVLGDFDGNGSFDMVDVRYFADGLYLVDGALDRRAGFVAIDECWQTLTGNANFFGTVIATGKAYEIGDSVADIAGSAGGPTVGYAPYGADGRIDAADIDYVYAQFRSNPNIADGVADWRDLNKAVHFDLSADLNGDLIVDDNDICLLVTGILGTSIGDVNLDGVVDSTDLAIAVAYRNGLDAPGGWANGDVDGDGLVTESDLAIIASGGGCACFCAADYNRDGGVDGADVESFFIDWEAAEGCADVNQDGGVDGADVEFFFTQWEAGGCD
ncbi:MAG: hypothetical protein KF864_05480 [Phycisphaeraceae bacterium]|nr:hypothetical protein [Phycisphaeraceae bacterium]